MAGNRASTMVLYGICGCPGHGPGSELIHVTPGGSNTRTPIVVMDGFRDHRDQRSMPMKAGAADFLLKPFRSDHMMRR